MDITVKIEAPQLADAINALAVAIAGNMELLLHNEKTAINVQQVTPEVITESVQLSTNSVAETATTQNAETQNGSVEIPTIVELRAKAQEKGKTEGGKPAIKALLNKYESKSISNVPEEKRAAFMAELEAL